MQSLDPGTEIGAYRIVRPLGQGGMGAVYEVEHVTLGVHYALKTFILENGHSELFRKRFLAEGRLLARLKHPNLVRVFDLAWDEASGQLYYVMDLVLYSDGEAHTLADIEQGTADEDHLKQWFSELCQALAYVHAQGIVHRDIKLGNILLAPDRHVVLSDFGISKVLGDRLRTDIDVSQTMVSVTDAASGGKLIMGTKGYMAPEVQRGDPVTPAADVYALGVVFFYLITGVWYDKVLAEKDRTDLRLLQHYEYNWQELLPRMLAEDPARRPTDLADLPRQLRPVQAPQPPRRRLTGRLAWAAIGIAAGLCAVAWFLLSAPSRARPVEPDDGWLAAAFAVPESMR